MNLVSKLAVGVLLGVSVYATELLDRNLAYSSPFLGIREVCTSFT